MSGSLILSFLPVYPGALNRQRIRNPKSYPCKIAAGTSGDATAVATIQS
jgi:hypothetical protein